MSERSAKFFVAPAWTREARRPRMVGLHGLRTKVDAAGLDLRHVEDVVDDVQQIPAAFANVAANIAYLSTPSGPNMPLP